MAFWFVRTLNTFACSPLTPLVSAVNTTNWSVCECVSVCVRTYVIWYQYIVLIERRARILCASHSVDDYSHSLVDRVRLLRTVVVSCKHFEFKWILSQIFYNQNKYRLRTMFSVQRAKLSTTVRLVRTITTASSLPTNSSAPGVAAAEVCPKAVKIKTW